MWLLLKATEAWDFKDFVLCLESISEPGRDFEQERGQYLSRGSSTELMLEWWAARQEFERRFAGSKACA